MPVRKVSNRGGNIIGKFPSIKMRKMIAFESLIERDFIYLLDYEKEVECFEEQPITIEYEYEGKLLHYTPDFHLVERGHDVLVECKPEKFVTTEENQRKAATAVNWCIQYGWEYRVVTDQQIRRGFRLQNVKLLTRYARVTVPPQMQADVYFLINNRQNGEITIDDVVRTISPEEPTLVLASILQMVFYHKIRLPLDLAAISGQMPVYLPLGASKEDKV